MQKLVLDLRQNPGGLLDAAVGVADHFLDKGQMIVYTKGRTADSAQDYTAPGKHQKVQVPLVFVGGGITPDVLVKPAPLTRTTQLLEVRSAIFNYGVDYAAKHPDLNKDLV